MHLYNSRLEMVMRYAHPQSEHKAQAIRTIEEFVIEKQMEEAARSRMVQ